MFLSIRIFARQEEGGGGRWWLGRGLENLVLSLVRTAPQLSQNPTPASSTLDAAETFSENIEYLQFVAKYVGVD